MDSRKRPTLLEVYQQQITSFERQKAVDRESRLDNLKTRLQQYKKLPQAYLDAVSALANGPESVAVLR